MLCVREPTGSGERSVSKREICLGLLVWLFVALGGCSSESGVKSDGSQGRDDDEGPRLPSSTAVNSSDWFVERSADVGLQFVHFNGMSGEFFFPEIMPPGVGLVDVDGDGDLDIFLPQGDVLVEGLPREDAIFPPTGPEPPTGRLFRNDMDVAPDGAATLRFTDVTRESGIDAGGYGMGVSAGDIDNDGWVDLYLTYFGRNRLFRNEGDGTFVDVSVASGTDDAGWGISASFVDYDRDGWLDLYVGNYVQYDVNTDVRCARLTSQRSYCGPQSYLPQTDRLYRNRGDGTFEDVTATALISPSFGPALGVSAADFNGDGWMDIYVANDQSENLLWINQADGTFRDAGLLSGAVVDADGRPEASMGVDAGDFDNDGDDDLIMTHIPEEGHNLYVNSGTGSFADLSASAGFHRATLGYTGWGTGWFDYDNDGWLDILAVNGAIFQIPEQEGDPFPFGERNLLLRNGRDGQFEDVTDQAGSAFTLIEVSRGAAFGDIDNDGDTDVVVANLSGPVRLLVNTVGDTAHWLGLRLVGAMASTDMVGARIEVTRPDEPALWRRARADGSYASANDPRVLVGLGGSTTPPTIRVIWPTGEVEVWPDMAIDQWVTLTQGTSPSP